MIAILGSGFGLYGYLPALVEGCGQRVVLPKRYRDRYHARPELARFSPEVEWEVDEAAALDRADGAVLALRPSDQAGWLTQCLARNNLGRLLLEKPLAANPELARMLYDKIACSATLIRIGYTFRFTAWAERLRNALRQSKDDSTLVINWTFLSHHLQHNLHNWKRTTASGGGAIRFYGIQLIALLPELGYGTVSSSHSSGASKEEIDRWEASFTGSGLPVCHVLLDTQATVARFRVELAEVLADQSDPFESENQMTQHGKLDRRIPALTSLCRTLWEPTTNEPACYAATIELWRVVEEKTIFERRELVKL